MKNFSEEMPGKISELLSLARSRKKQEVRSWASSQAETLRAQEPNPADPYLVNHYSESNGFGYGAEAWNGLMADIDGMYAEVEQAVMAYATPDPEGFTPLINTMEQVHLVLKGREADSVAAEASADLVSDWQGSFTDTLQDFLSPVGSVESNQAEIAEVLTESLRATQAIYGTAQSDVAVLVDDAIEALEACGESNGSDVVAVLMLMGTILGGVGAIVGVSMAVAGASLTVLSTGVNYVAGSGVIRQGGGEHPMGADTVDGVMNNLVTGLNQVLSGMESDEQKVIRNLEINIGIVNMLRGAAHEDGTGSRYLPLAPTINTATDPTSALVPND